jgi:hypothetical protein
MDVKEYDVIKTKDGRTATVVLIHSVPDLAYEVEYEDAEGQTEAIQADQIDAIIWRS